MPNASIFSIILAWLVALGGVLGGLHLLLDGNVNGMVASVLLTLFISIGLIFYAMHRDRRCNGFYEIEATPLDILGVLIA